MKAKWIGVPAVALPIVVGGFVLANTQAASDKAAETAKAAGYTCPLTGEELPCPKCCPLGR